MLQGTKYLKNISILSNIENSPSYAIVEPSNNKMRFVLMGSL
jgi:hypothetical protein